jgi:hypothetical protein
MEEKKNSRPSPQINKYWHLMFSWSNETRIYLLFILQFRCIIHQTGVPDPLSDTQNKCPWILWWRFNIAN